MSKDLITRVGIYAANAINPAYLANPGLGIICGGSDLVRELSPGWQASPYRRLLNGTGALIAVGAALSGLDLSFSSLFETAFDASLVYALGKQALTDYPSLSVLRQDLSLMGDTLSTGVRTIEDRFRQ
ncbi:hypothetical protein EXS74_00575 [Candidatus Woesearchaeota archaeon]|nr:hypothetical protein [Candidatus Woesearchaeota archaeon]